MSLASKAVAVVVLGVVLASSATAQEAGEASLIGERVRARHCNASGKKSPDGRGPCFRTEGQVLAVTPDVLRIQQPKGTVRDVPRAEVQRLERFLGSNRSVGRSIGRGALIGGGIGLGLGLALGLAVAAEAGDDTVALLVVGAPLAGGALGALIGAGVGALPKERWTDVAESQWTVTAVGGGGRVGLGLRLAF